MAFLLGGANTLSAAYDVENSCRFEKGDSPKLHRAVSSTGSERKCTVSVWVKRANLSTRQQIYSNKTADEAFEAMNMYFRAADNRLEIDHSDGSTSYTQKTTMRFRDVSAWYHIVHSVDTTDGTAGDRLRTYVNGVEITDFATDNNPSQNDDLHLSHTTGDQSIGDDPRDSNDLFDGYMAEFAFVDGTDLAASAFGKTDSSGIWKPKDFKDDITWGTNGFYLEFKQTGTGTASTSTIGADTSGNTNHLTSTNLAATDITVDTPTNNFCTLNPLHVKDLDEVLTYSEGNLKAVSGDANYHQGNGTIAIPESSGLWYFECQSPDAPDGSSQEIQVGVDTEAGSDSLLKSFSNSFADPGGNLSADVVVGVLINRDTDELKIYAADSLEVTVSLPATGILFPIIRCYGADTDMIVNFGSPTTSISSGNSDPNGYGNFEYATKSGYAICTKNLAEFG